RRGQVPRRPCRQRGRRTRGSQLPWLDVTGWRPLKSFDGERDAGCAELFESSALLLSDGATCWVDEVVVVVARAAQAWPIRPPVKPRRVATLAVRATARA